MSEPRRTRRRLLDPLHIVDVFVYVIVLNLATAYFPGVILESFTISLVTAVLLKLVLEVVLFAKKKVLRRIRGAQTVLRRSVSIGMLVLLLPGSKFLVLWLEDIVLGDAVTLGGFWSVTLLIVSLMAARWGVRRLLEPLTPRPTR